MNKNYKQEGKTENTVKSIMFNWSSKIKEMLGKKKYLVKLKLSNFPELMRCIN